MQHMTNVRNVTALCAAGATLLALTACGKNGDSASVETAAAALTSSASSATATSAATPTPISEAATPTDVQSPAVEESKPAEAPAPAPAPEKKPENPMGTAAEQGMQPIQPQQGHVAPIEGGRPANPGEVEGITALLRRPEQQTTMRGYMENMVDSMCTQLVEENGGREALRLNEFPEIQLRDLPDYEANRTTVTGVDGVMVDGVNASANVTISKTNGESETNTMRFRNEGGDWKLCK